MFDAAVGVGVGVGVGVVVDEKAERRLCPFDTSYSTIGNLNCCSWSVGSTNTMMMMMMMVFDDDADYNNVVLAADVAAGVGVGVEAFVRV